MPTTYADVWSKDPLGEMKYQQDVDESGKPMGSATITPMGQAAISATTGREVGGEYRVSDILRGQKKLQDEYDAKNAAWDLVAKHGYDFNEAQRIAKSQISARDEMAKSQIEESLADAEEAKEQAAYGRQLSQMRAELARAKASSPLAEVEDNLNEIADRYSHLAGARNPEIAKTYDAALNASLKAVQNQKERVQRRLPRGIGIEEIMDESGNPDFALARSLAMQSDAERDKSKEAIRQAAWLEREATRSQNRQERDRMSQQAALIRDKVKKGLDVEKYKELLPFKEEFERFKAGALMGALSGAGQPATAPTTPMRPEIVSPVQTAPAVAPSVPAQMHSQQAQPSATTGFQPREGMKISQKGKTYEYRNGKFVLVQE